jgi:hypothetical protein
MSCGRLLSMGRWLTLDLVVPAVARLAQLEPITQSKTTCQRQLDAYNTLNILKLFEAQYEFENVVCTKHRVM